MHNAPSKPIRPLRLLVRALLLGLLVNLLVTWSLAMWRSHLAPAAVTHVGWVNGGPVRWRIRRIVFPGMTRLYWTVDTFQSGQPKGRWRIDPGLAPSWSRVRSRPPDPADARVASLLVEVGFGWPWTAACYEYRRLGSSWTDRRTPALGAIDLGDKGAVPLTLNPRGRIEVCALPYRVAWTGLIGNTMVFAVMIVLVRWLPTWLGPRLFVREHRRRAGLCVWCGYDLKATEGDRCPECGRDGRARAAHRV